MIGKLIGLGLLGELKYKNGQPDYDYICQVTGATREQVNIAIKKANGLDIKLFNL